MNDETLDAVASHAPEGTPAITFLNMSGDVTICWDDHNREHILALVKQKMAEGYAFFVITPRVLPVLGNKKVALKNIKQLDKAVGVVVTDEQVEAIVANLGDAAVQGAVQSGQAKLTQVARSNLQTTHRARNADEVVRSQSVAVRPIVGG